MDDRKLILAMTDFDGGDPMRIQHFMKVYAYARLIGELEGLEEKTLLILRTAALVHDIGIHPAEEQFGCCDGKKQELLGPGEAEKMLLSLGYPPQVIERVCYLVGHHHTYHQIDQPDYQILVEADFIVNAYEDGFSSAQLAAALENIFRTPSGRRIFCRCFGLAE